MVLLSEHEAYSLVVAEALAANTPCIVADGSALHEWIDEKNCFGIKLPVNLDQLKDRIQYLTSNTKKILKSKIIDEKLLDWKDVTLKIMEIYES